MRTLCFIICSIFFCTVGWAQHGDSQTRAITLKILDKKERPVRNILVQSVHTGKAGFTDRSGIFVFEEMSDDDAISVLMKRNVQLNIPVSGMDSIVVKAVSSNYYSYEHQGEIMIAKIERPLTSNDDIVLDVPAMLKQRAYISLIDLLKSGQVPGLKISSGSTFSDQDASVLPMRGPNTVNSGTQPLVILDGTPLGSLNEANSMVNVNSIKTIEIKKSGSGYGLRGANGVIVINTR